MNPPPPSSEIDATLPLRERRHEFLYLLMCAVVALISLTLLLIVFVTRRPPVPAAPMTPYVGESIVAAGQSFEIGTPVALWTHELGYNAYRTDYFFAESRDHPKRLKGGENKLRVDQRADLLTAGPELDDGEVPAILREAVDVFVIHYDVCGVSRQCFKILHDIRGLSVHFMLDVDGTIYQTLDLKERARHASHMNDRSIGVEIAHPGAYGSLDQLNKWYREDETGLPVLTLPEWFTDDGILTPEFIPRPSRLEPIWGTIHGRRLVQYDFTDAQYESLIHLVAGLNRVFPKIVIDAPRDAEGRVRTDLLSPREQQQFHGLIGHWHFDRDKTDPGPAFDWERVIKGARALQANSEP